MLVKDNKILLGFKKRGFGAGRWNGFGGKVENGENIKIAAARELSEEAGIVAKKLEKRAVLTFTHEHNDKIHEVHVFSADDFSGELLESEEMKPAWFDIDDIPYADMWPDDKFWLPYFLQKKKFLAKFHLVNNDQEVSGEMDLVEVQDFK